MPKWLRKYLNWWGSDTKSLKELNFIDVLIILIIATPIILAPLVVLFLWNFL